MTLVLATKVVKVILDAILSKSLSDKGLERLLQHSNTKPIGRNKPAMKFIICPDCEKVFTSEQGMTIHVGKAHKKAESKKMCVVNTCSFKSNSAEDHHKHMTKEHKELLAEPSDPVPKTECENCTEPFRSKTALKNHI